VAALFVLLAEKSSPRRSLALAMLAVSYLITGHWLAGSSTLLGALALLGVLYAQLFARRVSGRRASFSLTRWMRIFRQDSDRFCRSKPICYGGRSRDERCNK
jgi:hypothetical protein